MTGNTATESGGGIDAQAAAGSSELINLTIYDNEAPANAGGGVFGGPVEIHNCVLFNNVGDDVADIEASLAAHNCSRDYVSGDLSNVLLAQDPISVGPNGQLFLNPAITNPCIDGGNDEKAAVFEWATMTTQADGALDLTPVDMGRHYD